MRCHPGLCPRSITGPAQSLLDASRILRTEARQRPWTLQALVTAGERETWVEGQLSGVASELRTRLPSRLTTLELRLCHLSSLENLQSRGRNICCFQVFVLGNTGFHYVWALREGPKGHMGGCSMEHQCMEKLETRARNGKDGEWCYFIKSSERLQKADSEII